MSENPFSRENFFKQDTNQKNTNSKNPQTEIHTNDATWLEYLKSREFLIIIGCLFASVFLVLIFLFFILFPIITKHGETAIVPSVTSDIGKKKFITFDKAFEILTAEGFDVEVSDSDYVADCPPLTVTYQDPSPKDVVKPGRKIYLRINKRETPKEKFPNVLSENLPYVEEKLRNFGFKIGNIKMVPGNFPNFVVNASHQGRLLRDGSEVPKGATIDLEVSKGRKPTKVLLPDLVGLTIEEVDNELRSLGLSYNTVLDIEPGIEDGHIYRQDPRYKKDSIEQGSVIVIWVSSTGPSQGNEDNKEGESEKVDKKGKKND